MIGSLSGKISHIYLDHILLDVGGVGYQVFLPQRIISSMAKGDNIFVLIHTVVREDNISLFGFLDPYDKQVFLELNKVSGVGIKTALSILGVMPAEEIINSISYEDSNNFTRVPGIGNKAAQRIVNELKDKVGKISKGDNVVSVVKKRENNVSGGGQMVLHDAVSALENLGYQRAHILDIVKDICKDEDDLANVISKSLKVISAS